MLGQDMRELYIDHEHELRNMLMYLMEEEARMIKADRKVSSSQSYPVYCMI
jgi:hypothetical protein